MKKWRLRSWSNIFWILDIGYWILDDGWRLEGVPLRGVLGERVVGGGIESW